MSFSTGEATTVEQVLEVIPVEEVIEEITVEEVLVPEVPVPEVPEAAETGEVPAGERRVAEEKEKNADFHGVDQYGCKPAVLHSFM